MRKATQVVEQRTIKAFRGASCNEILDAIAEINQDSEGQDIYNKTGPIIVRIFLTVRSLHR